MKCPCRLCLATAHPNMSKIRRSSALIPTPKAFVRSVLSKLTLPCGALWTKRPGVVTPYWSHGLLDYVMVRYLSLHRYVPSPVPRRPLRHLAYNGRRLTADYGMLITPLFLAERHRLEHGLRALHALAASGYPPARAAQARARSETAVSVLRHRNSPGLQVS